MPRDWASVGRHLETWNLDYKLHYRALFSLSLSLSLSLLPIRYDKFGNAQWDIVSNSRILDIELGLNVRSYVGGWNCTTSKWIRR